MKLICAILAAGALLTGAAMWGQEPAVENQVFEKHVTIRTEGPDPHLDGEPGGPIQFVAMDLVDAMKVVKNAPYTADVSSETVQVLADGNRIVHATSSQVARDSQGRTMRHDTLGAIGALAADKPHEVIFVNDPAANINWVLEPDSKTARMMTVAKYQGVPAPNPLDVLKAAPPGSVRTFTTVRTTAKTEPLGTRVIEGVACDGARQVMTIAAGQMGNERPIEIVTERWYSQELQALVYSKRSDPRTGETTYKLTNIQRGEPSSLLFEVPADYKVVDGGNMRFMIRQNPAGNK